MSLVEYKLSKGIFQESIRSHSNISHIDAETLEEVWRLLSLNGFGVQKGGFRCNYLIVTYLSQAARRKVSSRLTKIDNFEHLTYLCFMRR